MKFVVTTTQSQEDIIPVLREFIAATGFDFVPRRRRGLADIARERGADGVIVWEATGPVLNIQGEKLFFHPGMAKSRIAAYRKKGQEDLLIKACQLQPGWSFLDCTLGMGADAIVASYFSRTGRITGLESEAAIAAVIGWGMKMYAGRMAWLNQAVNRIEVICSRHQDYLQRLPERAYDIVYFDPMFEQPVLKSQPLNPLRKLANPQSLDPAAVQQACRVARRRVVMKTQAASGEIERLGMQKVPGSRHNPITYGVIDT
ncbi:MAG: class I SAM-dependent methyltransferase [Syntrophomonadaceae bacterium]